MKKLSTVFLVCIVILIFRDSEAANYPINEFPISTNPATLGKPNISGNLTVWDDARHLGSGLYSIYGYDLTANMESLIYSNNSRLEDLSFGGDIIAWRDYRNDTADVYGYNLSTQTMFPIATGTGTQYSPSVSSDGSIVVWEGAPPGQDYGIYGYDVASQTTFPISTNPVSHNGFGPQVDGDYVVWRDYRNGNHDIYAYNMSTQTEFPITTEQGDQFDARISNNIVVWDDNRNNSRIITPLSASSPRFCSRITSPTFFSEATTPICFKVSTMSL